MQVNHLGHFLLTNLLLPKLEANPPNSDVRVVTVSSSTHHLTKALDLADLNCEKKPYTLFGQYEQSKLANVMFSLELSRRQLRKSQVSERSERALCDKRVRATNPLLLSCFVKTAHNFAPSSLAAAIWGSNDGEDVLRSPRHGAD